MGFPLQFLLVPKNNKLFSLELAQVRELELREFANSWVCMVL